MAQLVASVSVVVLGGVAMAVGSSLTRGEIFTASIGSVDSLYPSLYIYEKKSFEKHQKLRTLTCFYIAFKNVDSRIKLLIISD